MLTFNLAKHLRGLDRKRVQDRITGQFRWVAKENGQPPDDAPGGAPGDEPGDAPGDAPGDPPGDAPPNLAALIELLRDFRDK